MEPLVGNGVLHGEHTNLADNCVPFPATVDVDHAVERLGDARDGRRAVHLLLEEEQRGELVPRKLRLAALRERVHLADLVQLEGRGQHLNDGSPTDARQEGPQRPAQRDADVREVDGTPDHVFELLHAGDVPFLVGVPVDDLDPVLRDRFLHVHAKLSEGLQVLVRRLGRDHDHDGLAGLQAFREELQAEEVLLGPGGPLEDDAGPLRESAPHDGIKPFDARPDPHVTPLVRLT